MPLRAATLLVAVSAVMMSSRLEAQDRPYTDGSVWAIDMVRTTTGMQADYLEALATTWKKINDEGKKQGLILNYRVFVADPVGPDDWDLMLVTEYKNWAALDGSNAKWDAILAKVVGMDQNRQIMTNRIQIRRVVGSKKLQELIFK